MNMFVSSAVVAAAPAVAMNSAAHEPPAIDHKAILARVEQIVDLLRTRYICEGWKMDEHGAARALDYFRRHVEGPAFKDEDEDTAAYHQALEFFSAHGQNLDWIHDGNPGGMICTLAQHSRRANEAADAQLSALEEEIFGLNELYHEHDEEMCRLQAVWVGELHRLEDLRWTGGVYSTAKENYEAVKAMPEAKEHSRLVAITEQHRQKMDALIKQMWTIPARTPEGRRSKLLVLLSCVMGGKWTVVDEDADWEIGLARKLMIEFVGGEPATQLRDQFA